MSQILQNIKQNKIILIFNTRTPGVHFHALVPTNLPHAHTTVQGISRGKSIDPFQDDYVGLVVLVILYACKWVGVWVFALFIYSCTVRLLVTGLVVCIIYIPIPARELHPFVTIIRAHTIPLFISNLLPNPFHHGNKILP